MKRIFPHLDVSHGLLLASLMLLCLPACNPPISEDEALLASLPEEVDFNYHVRPILSDRCFKCHGPDANTRETDLRLDTEEGAFSKLTESPRNRAIVAGSLRRSEMAHRIVSDDPDYAMPPPASNLALTDYEVALLRKWIDQGAEWKEHWAFIKPEEPVRPSVQNSDWPQNEIDHFVLARLEREGIAPSPPADRERLLRRVYLDLTGLPPSVADIDAFLADTSEDAYARVVDKLLASTAYAERMAVDWMDVSRYADSHGYHADGYRMMWPWRDWVIEAFDENMPYDEFITLQLAGDLLPNATAEQKLATAFHRNHQMTAEGGIVDEEYRLQYVADRTNTTARAFMGLTMECAQCHDHKFDPVSQAEYFQMTAFFNNLNEVGMTGDDGNAGPMLLLFEEGQEAQLEALRDSIAALEQLVEQRTKALEGELADISANVTADLDRGLVAYYPLDVLMENTTPNSVRGVEGASVSGEVELIEGVHGKATRFDYDFDFLALQKVGLFERYEPFSIALWAKPEKEEAYAELIGNAGQKNTYWRGYEVYLDSLNRVNARLIHALPNNYIHVRTTDGVTQDAWNHVALVYDGSSKAAGVKLFIDGQQQDQEVLFDKLYKSIHPVGYQKYQKIDQPLRVGKSYRAFTGDDGIYTGAMDDIRIYNRALTPHELHALQPAASGKGTPAHHRAVNAPEIVALRAKLRALREEESSLLEPVEEIMVMEEMDVPRPTYVLNRGAYDQPTDEVTPGTPAVVLAFDETAPKNRQGLAQWLTDADNPLTARVTVNRFWQMYFGKGIVETPADFGYQGALPEHPELLDWLATTFIASGWDVKAIQRTIVMSATYQQSSRVRSDLQDIDPLNQLLARASSQRLTAEMIRDNALAASGLLVEKVGGPSAKPYQPEGLWIEKGTFSAALLNYEADKGDGLYRRSLYTFIKRTSPPPAMIAFDATDRSECTVERQSTSTPLQSLILMNDPQFVEAGRKLAERMQEEGGDTVAAQITYGYRALTGMRPADAARDLLVKLYNEEVERFRRDPSAARALLTVGDSPGNAALNTAATAALAVVANTIINHDASYMKR
ncbi:MAG: DUF1553 domain-containing protein [Bacteroidota bacterium]